MCHMSCANCHLSPTRVRIDGGVYRSSSAKVLKVLESLPTVGLSNSFRGGWVGFVKSTTAINVFLQCLHLCYFVIAIQ